jgi:mono/diheme cytochrome c family protein
MDLIGLIGLIALGLTQTAPASGDADGHLAQGRRLAERYCGSCHATGPMDQSAIADAPPFRALGQSIDLASLPKALRAGLMDEHPRMPLVRLDVDEIADLTAYVRSLQPPSL